MPAFHSISRRLVVALALFAAASACAGEPQSPGLTVHGGRFFLNGSPFRGVGVNYFDLFGRLLANPNNTSSLTGLERLASAGVPFVRFDGGGFSPQDWRRYLDRKEDYFASFDRVVRTAEKTGVGLIPSVFWNSNLQKLVGEHRDAWGRPESRTMALMRQYVADLVGRYKDSPAIWAWELGNEWNLGADLPNAATFRKPGEDERDDMTSPQMAIAIREFAAAVRAIDKHRPIISGHSHPRSSSWHNTAEKSWKPDNREQWKQILLRDNTTALDTIGIHIYADKDASEVCGNWTTGWSDYLGSLRALADEKKLPVFIGEFGLADGGKHTREQVRNRFEEILTAMNGARVDLAAVWVFDLPGQDKSWNITFENERAYMLDLVVAANKRWKTDR